MITMFYSSRSILSPIAASTQEMKIHGKQKFAENVGNKDPSKGDLSFHA